MEVKTKKNNFIFWVSLIILLFIIFFHLLLLKSLQDNVKYKLLGYFISVILQLCFFTLFMKYFIKESIIKNNKNRIGLSLLTNMGFFMSSTLFIFNNTYLKELGFQISSLIILLIMVFILSKIIKIENGDDLSILKSINYILVSIFIGVTYILEEHAKNNILKYYINIYYILPLLMLQGLYEALDGKSKILPNKENHE